MSYVFFPGCSLDGTAKDFHRSTLAVAAKLGLDLPELKDWICCGSTAAHSTDPLLADALPAKSLSAAGGEHRRGGLRRLLQPAEDGQPPHRRRCRRARQGGPGRGQRLRRPDAGSPPAGDPLPRHRARARSPQAITRPLAGLKVACYYGCLLSRPPEITNFDDAENPTLMDQLMETAGATPLDWPHKTECCGASFSITDSQHRPAS